MKVWVLWYTHGTVSGVLDCAADADLSPALALQAGHLRRQYDVEGEFSRARSPEPYFRDDERVYRNGGITLIARPFTIGVPA